MKLLIVGIDGLGTENIGTFGLKRLQARMAAGTSGAVGTAHRISRGWCEIYSGVTAAESGAYYQIPHRRPEGRIVPTQKTGVDQVEKSMGRDSLLWHRLEAMGYSVGVLTVPTVTRPVELSGFSVAATGGGRFGGALGADDLFPADLLSGLTLEDPDLGLRMGYGGFLPADLGQFERKVDKHLEDYTRVLHAALEKRPCNALFMASRVLTEMAYKFTALVQSDPSDPDARALRTLVLEICDRFDELIDRLIEELAPENLFVVSDHGIRATRAEINLNESLVQMGLLRRDTVRNIARHGHHLYKRLRAKQPISPVVRQAYRYDRSTAFSIGYIDALYLTDQRFGGRPLDAAARTREAAALADRLTGFWAKKAPEAGLSFSASGLSPYSGDAETPDAGGVPNPDILCHTPEGVVNLKETPGLIDHPASDFGKALFRTGFPGEFSATKSNDTFAGYVGPHGDAVRLTHLTDLYGAILTVADRAK